jgi:hypothetical protein
MHTPHKRPPKLPEALEHRVRRDADLADIGRRSRCIEEIGGIAQRSASLIDDGVNAVEASEERIAAFEAQSMRLDDR